MARNLDAYQGRNPLQVSAMFGEGFTAGRTRAEDVPIHFVRISGFSDSHDAVDSSIGPGLDCVECMGLAARKRQWVEGLRLGPDDPPAHER